MTTPIHPKLAKITERITERNHPIRKKYLAKIHNAEQMGQLERNQLGCNSSAHGYTSISKSIKIGMLQDTIPNLDIIAAYNDMISAHQPFKDFLDQIRDETQKNGATAQVADGTPTMCDGITQGYAGVELSLFSHDVIAMSTAVGLSHQMFDDSLFMDVCGKTIPGLIIGALSFGRIPGIFVPAGPMSNDIDNKERVRTRQLFVEGEVSRDALLGSEMGSYHSPGTCAFYGTASSSQMMMEMMDVYLPTTALIHPHTDLHGALAHCTAGHLARGIENDTIKSLGEMLIEKPFINAPIGLMATGGSTNHIMHLIAMTRTAGVTLDWDDFDKISSIIPLLIRVYPSGRADVNHFTAAGGLPFVIRELLDAGLLHDSVDTVVGRGMRHHTREPFLIDGELKWREAPETSGSDDVLHKADNPFSPDGGLRLMKGSIGRGVIKVSVVYEGCRVIEAPVIVFNGQRGVLAAFERGELERGFVCVARYQGLRVSGMSGLRKLTPPLGILQDRGFKVALLIGGHISGAPGKIPASTRMTPEALIGGNIAKIRTDDLIRFDSVTGKLNVLINEAEWNAHEVEHISLSANQQGYGRELFANFRSMTGSVETGAVNLGGEFA